MMTNTINERIFLTTAALIEAFECDNADAMRDADEVSHSLSYFVGDVQRSAATYAREQALISLGVL